MTTKTSTVKPQLNAARKNILIAVIGLTVLAILGAVIFVAMNQNPSFKESTTYQQIESITTVENTKPASIIIAPATENWWKKLSNFSSNTDLKNIDYNTLSKGATTVAFSLSNAKKYENFSSIGVPTSYIIYDTAAAAEKASQNLYTISTPFYLKDNILMIIPQGAFIDVDYSVTNYEQNKKTVDETELKLDGKAVWNANIESFSKLLSQNKNENDIKVYNQTIKNLGVTEKSEWQATSEDGLTWDGKVSNFTQPKKPSETMDYLISQIRPLDKNGKVINENYENIPEEEQSGLLALRQSILQNFMAISDKNETVGSYSKTDGTKETISEAGENEVGKAIINPNEWFSYIVGAEISYPVTYFSEAQISVKNIQGDITLKLVEGTW